MSRVDKQQPEAGLVMMSATPQSRWDELTNRDPDHDSCDQAEEQAKDHGVHVVAAQDEVGLHGSTNQADEGV